jgi:transcriptional regulator with XRE-family HTH domain
MSSQVVLLNINPSVLKWAREEAGYSIPKIVGEIKTTESIYREWENSGNKIPFNTLKEFSRIYKRQISVFFLPFTPPKTIKPTDYRNITKARANLSQKTLLSMIRVDNFRDFFIEQNGYDYTLKNINGYQHIIQNIIS